MPNLWKLPVRIKVYEALGALADERLQLISSSRGTVTSSSGNKTYDVIYTPETNEINTNDNASYWQGYLGYPALAFLMKIGLLPFDESLASSLKGISWKEINQKFKNDFSKTECYIYQTAPQHQLELFAAKTISKLESLKLIKPLKRLIPPKGY